MADEGNWLMRRLQSKTEGPVKGQTSGSIRGDAGGLVVCKECSEEFGTREHPIVGVPRKHWKSHAAFHVR